MAHYHQYVIDHHRDCTGQIKQGLRLYYEGTSTYQVIPSNDGTNAVLYGANPEKPLVYFGGKDQPFVKFRGLEDGDRIVESLMVNEFLVNYKYRCVSLSMHRTFYSHRSTLLGVSR
jgi:hypothetical protein